MTEYKMGNSREIDKGAGMSIERRASLDLISQLPTGLSSDVESIGLVNY